MGCDKMIVLFEVLLKLFQFTQPGWAATYDDDKISSLDLVSIHAARMGCDSCLISLAKCQKRFNSRSPDGLRPHRSKTSRASSLFQFTQPGWAATLFGEYCIRDVEVVSIHAARMGCDPHRLTLIFLRDVSIHAARMGCDSDLSETAIAELKFQFTQPGWAATYPCT
ncbi:Uncharacterised protein [Porphyromonas cangingivalis]|nr:Uncharacterised protein [Porphyromonas cangingivalis]